MQTVEFERERERQMFEALYNGVDTRANRSQKDKAQADAETKELVQAPAGEATH